jgi:hypothetical protein
VKSENSGEKRKGSNAAYRPLELFQAHMSAALRVAGGDNHDVDKSAVICDNTVKT